MLTCKQYKCSLVLYRYCTTLCDSGALLEVGHGWRVLRQVPAAITE